MPKFKVSYTIDSGTATEEEIRAYIEEDLDGQGLVIEKISPEFEDGWYQRLDDQMALWFSAEEIRAYPARVFFNNYFRVNPPTPYEVN